MYIRFTDEQKQMLLGSVNEIAKNCGIDNYIISILKHTLISIIK